MKNNQTIGITGGTGSFGSTFLKNILEKKDFYGDIIVFSRDETKQEALRREIQNERVKFIVGDVRDTYSLESFCEKVDVIFHAAAMKYVPVCEFNPYQSVLTNINGSENLLNIANKYSVHKVVMLSTDKAVEPINAMGISKAMMEKLGIAKTFDSLYKTKICITRYGNVLGSRGSVIPFFVERIQKNESIPITNPNMTRFVMSLDESVSLVLYAMQYGEHGEVLVQKSPSARVDTIAKAVMYLMQTNQKLEYIGDRHSEKMHETLVSRNEMSRSLEKEDYFIINPDKRGMNYESEHKNIKNESFFHYGSDNTNQLSVSELAEYISNQKFWKKINKT